MFTIYGLLSILVVVLILPFVSKTVERNLEIFLFIMGLAAALTANAFTKGLVFEILCSKFIYMISIAVFISGLVFERLKHAINKGIRSILDHMPFALFTFLLIVVLGLASSVITAIVASLVLVEIVNALPVNRKMKINIVILSCFSIGLGAVLTPVGEPLATVVVSKLHADFTFLLLRLGAYIIPCIFALGIAGALLTGIRSSKEAARIETAAAKEQQDIIENSAAEEVFEDSAIEDIFEDSAIEIANEISTEESSFAGVIERTVKVFVFVMALELLGAGFKPLIDQYVINFSSQILYWLNMISAVLDNATLASAEISSKMSERQILAVLMGLLISGGMLIPGNIPNIISAGKLKINSKEWARTGVPLGLIILTIFFIIIY